MGLWMLRVIWVEAACSRFVYKGTAPQGFTNNCRLSREQVKSHDVSNLLLMVLLCLPTSYLVIGGTYMSHYIKKREAQR